MVRGAGGPVASADRYDSRAPDHGVHAAGPIVEPGPATQPGRRGVRVRWGGPQGSGGSEHRALLTGRVRVDKTDGLQLVVVVGPGGLSRVTEPALRSAQIGAYQRYRL